MNPKVGLPSHEGKPIAHPTLTNHRLSFLVSVVKMVYLKHAIVAMPNFQVSVFYLTSSSSGVFSDLLPTFSF